MEGGEARIAPSASFRCFLLHNFFCCSVLVGVGGNDA